MTLHILFPLPTMLFQADLSLPWVPPGLIKSLPLCKVGQCCRKGCAQESTDGKLSPTEEKLRIQDHRDAEGQRGFQRSLHSSS